ncbi:hypothetical protein CMO90_01810 [Candidatus Woesearchaeota archaeon]|jgi:hypothetical protein|nr:hypothetical protein [Candidatus Woesearchaeota archaeon]|tara:strand:- start:247 stop:1305 length:1059 start_codon:yes stop_codon:yes gene_type:complete
MKNILSLLDYVHSLSKTDKELFSRIYSVSGDLGLLKVPKDIQPWVSSKFGSVEVVESQKIIRVDNRITFESSLFNQLRAKRPIDTNNKTDVESLIKKTENDPFCKPLTNTPRDSFGRVKGKQSISASNIAKYDSHHGLIIFKEHNPLKFSLSSIKDYLETAQKWINKVYKLNPERKFPFIMWNCLWKSGASIIHGHMQTVMAKEKHYGNIEKLKMFSDVYTDLFKADYFNDLFKCHEIIGLGFKKGKNKVLAHLTPIKDKETIIIAKELNDSSKTIYKVLKAYMKMGVRSFNVGIYLNPLDNSWKFPVIIRIVDRGNLSDNTTDFGGMEVFAGTSIISSDPFKIINNIKKEF